MHETERDYAVPFQEDPRADSVVTVFLDENFRITVKGENSQRVRCFGKNLRGENPERA
jgi:hypothetical protein